MFFVKTEKAVTLYEVKKSEKYVTDERTVTETTHNLNGINLVQRSLFESSCYNYCYCARCKSPHVHKLIDNIHTDDY